MSRDAFIKQVAAALRRFQQLAMMLAFGNDPAYF